MINPRIRKLRRLRALDFGLAVGLTVIGTAAARETYANWGEPIMLVFGSVALLLSAGLYELFRQDWATRRELQQLQRLDDPQPYGAPTIFAKPPASSGKDRSDNIWRGR